MQRQLVSINIALQGSKLQFSLHINTHTQRLFYVCVWAVGVWLCADLKCTCCRRSSHICIGNTDHSLTVHFLMEWLRITMCRMNFTWKMIFNIARLAFAYDCGDKNICSYVWSVQQTSELTSVNTVWRFEEIMVCMGSYLQWKSRDAYIFNALM